MNAHELQAAVRAPMSTPSVRQVITTLFSGTVTPEEGAAALTTWSARGETAEELSVLVEELLARATVVPLEGPCFDLCGTGGSELTRYNVSTTVAFILAAAGVPVAKHGNRGSRRPNGSFDLLDALGIPFQLPPQALVRLQRETGVCFLFARTMHPAVAAVAPMRKLAAGRTIFNLAGPLANPCRPRRQIVGVTKEATATVIAGALERLGVERAVVVRGHPGIDEVSVTGPTMLWSVSAGTTHRRTITDLHHAGLDHAALPGGDAPQNVLIFRDLIEGREQGPLADMVFANAGLALDCWRGVADPGGPDAREEARALVRGGHVASVVETHRRLAVELAS